MFANYDSWSGNDVCGADIGAAFPGPRHIRKLSDIQTAAVLVSYDRNMTLCKPTLGRETVTPQRCDARGVGQFFRLRSVRRLNAETQRDGAATTTQSQRNRRGAMTAEKRLRLEISAAIASGRLNGCAEKLARNARFLRLGVKSPQPRINFVDPVHEYPAVLPPRSAGAARTLRTVSDPQKESSKMLICALTSSQGYGKR